MATIELERFHAAGGASTRQSIAAWGVSAYTLTLTNPGDDSLELVPIDANAFFADCPFAARDKLVLWVDGVRRFHGWITAIGREATASDEAQRVRVSRPGWWLASTPIREPSLIKAITTGDFTAPRPGGGTITYRRATGCTWETPLGDLAWTSWDAQSTTAAQGQINRALYSALWAGAPIAIGTIGIDTPAPEQDTRNATSAAWILAALRYAPMSAGWWDYSGTVPTYHCCGRSGVTTFSHALSSGEEAVTVSPLYDQQAHAVRITYRYDDNGTEAEMEDFAGDPDWPDGPGALIIDADCGDAEGAAKAWYIGVAARLYAALGPLAYAGQLSISEGATALPWYRPGHALNLTGGRTEWATMAAVIQQYIRTGSAEADTCVIQYGAPDHLGVQDWLELSNIGNAATDAATRSDFDTPNRPGTYSDLGGPTAGDAPSGGLQFSAIGGTVALVGFDEYAGHVSTPPRFYRRASGSGSRNQQYYVGPTCGTPTGPLLTLALSGASTVSAAGLVTAQMVLANNGTPAAYGPAIGSTAGTPPECPITSLLGSTVTTATASTHTCSAACIDLGNYTSTIESGSGAVTLGDEDTEESAWERLLGTASWSAWSSSQSWASWEARTAGRTYARQKFRLRGEWTGLTGGWWYRLVIQLESRALPSGTWADAEQIEVILRAEPEAVLNDQNEIIGHTGRATLSEREIEADRGTEKRVKSWVFLADI